MRILFIFSIFIYLGRSEDLKMSPTFIGREFAQSSKHQIPPPPQCTFMNPDQAESISGIVSLWVIDPSTSWGTLLYLWREKVTTSCFTNFFGAHDKTLVSVKEVIIPIEEAKTLIQDHVHLQNEELKDLTLENQYYCSWMRTEEKTTIRTFIKRTKAHHFSGVDVFAAGKHWSHVKKSPHYYISGSRIGFMEKSFTDLCPLIRKFSKSGILTRYRDSVVITIPDVELQFSFDISGLSYLCQKDGVSTFLTEGGYILSSLDLVRFGHPLFFPRGEVRDFSLAADLHLARKEYELSFLYKLIEKDLMEIEREVCILRKQIWMLVKSLNDPNLWAQYISGDLYARGEFSDGLIQINQTITYSIPIRQDYPLISNSSGIYVFNSSEYIKIRPGSGLLITDTDSYNPITRWVPLSDGTGLDVVEGSIVYPSVLIFKNGSFHGNPNVSILSTIGEFETWSAREEDLIHEEALSTDWSKEFRVIWKWMSSTVWGILINVLLISGVIYLGFCLLNHLIRSVLSSRSKGHHVRINSQI